MMDELLEQFLIEGRDLVAQAAGDFAVLALDPGNAIALDSAFRAVHTLKGSVGLFALGPAERLLHTAEGLLDRARGRDLTINADMISGLITCLDLVDHWIDELEESGQLTASAEKDAQRAIAQIDQSSGAVRPAEGLAEAKESTDWLEAIESRAAELLAEATEPLTAFCYQPKKDCFFRGDDPLSLSISVPGLVTLSALPTDGHWPGLDQIEPFSCYAYFEGLSTSPQADLQAHFRLVPDQIKLAVIAPVSAKSTDLSIAVDRQKHQVLRIETGRIDAIADGMGELMIALNALTPLAAEMHRINPATATSLRKAQAQIERATTQLNKTISAVRSVPLEPALRRLPRLAREIAETLGKRVTFTMSTDGLEVDKQLADRLFEPLLHLLRNAIDHGIETPDERSRASKTPGGQVTLSVRREGDAILVTLRDDGRGIDPHRIKHVAAERGLLSEVELGTLSDAAALQLIFKPGFSTATAISEVSGRGVGMDAVRDAVDRMRGAVQVTSAVGHGTTFYLRLPHHSLTTRLLIVEIGSERYGVSLDQVVETVRLDPDRLIPVGQGLACVLRGRTVPILDLGSLLGHAERAIGGAKLLVTQASGQQVALRVDGFGERIDTVVRPVRGVLAGMMGLSGSAMLGSGDVLLVLNLPELAAWA
jgi:two-component system chemotaxis sensor kinase CheA